MNKSDVVKLVLHDRLGIPSKDISNRHFAPTNIALCKYWGKRNAALNLPVTSSLSISLPEKGAAVRLTKRDGIDDAVCLNGKIIDANTAFSQRLTDFLNLFRYSHPVVFDIQIETNIPIAAGLASSACGFASIVKALDDVFNWRLSNRELSILARLGSGSACRSIWNGFVEWHRGGREDGMDSFAEPLLDVWSDFCVGLLVLDESKKPISSREAMQITVDTSSLYRTWPMKVEHDLSLLKQAILERDFDVFGKTAESNALTMHATMLSAWPPIQYSTTETWQMIEKIWRLRREGLALYFTQDAGPNLKLLFLRKHQQEVQSCFPQLQVVNPFL